MNLAFKNMWQLLQMASAFNCDSSYYLNFPNSSHVLPIPFRLSLCYFAIKCATETILSTVKAAGLFNFLSYLSSYFPSFPFSFPSPSLFFALPCMSFSCTLSHIICRTRSLLRALLVHGVRVVMHLICGLTKYAMVPS